MIYCVSLSGVFVCACLYDRACLLFTAFVDLFVIYGVMLYVLLWCCFLYVCDLCCVFACFVFACFVCNLLCGGVWLVICVFVLCLCVIIV